MVDYGIIEYLLQSTSELAQSTAKFDLLHIALQTINKAVWALRCAPLALRLRKLGLFSEFIEFLLINLQFEQRLYKLYLIYANTTNQLRIVISALEGWRSVLSNWFLLTEIMNLQQIWWILD